MSDLIQRAQEVVSLASNPSMEQRERLVEIRRSCLRSETAQSDEITRTINELCKEHGLKRDEDAAELDETDIEHLLDLLTTVADDFIADELEWIVDELDAGTKELPIEAIRAVRQHRDLMVPKLIDILREATARAREGDVPDGNAHFFALFLLTELESKEAFPAMIDAVSLPGDLPFDLFGDAVTSTLARVLALFDAERQETIDALIRNADLNEYVRWEAAQTYPLLVRDGHLTRDEAVQRLHDHLREALERNDGEMAQGIVCVLADLAPKEALEDIETAYARNMVDPFLIRLEDVTKSIAGGEARIRENLDNCLPTGIDDTIAELKRWASYRGEEPVPEPEFRPPFPPAPPSPHFLEHFERPEPVTAPIRNEGPRVGRNDPCPCGSGKKHKKCCGRPK